MKYHFVSDILSLLCIKNKILYRQLIINITFYKLLLLYASHVSFTCAVTCEYQWHDMGILSSFFNIWNKDLRHINKEILGVLCGITSIRSLVNDSTHVVLSFLFKNKINMLINWKSWFIARPAIDSQLVQVPYSSDE